MATFWRIAPLTPCEVRLGEGEWLPYIAPGILEFCERGRVGYHHLYDLGGGWQLRHDPAFLVPLHGFVVLTRTLIHRGRRMGRRSRFTEEHARLLGEEWPLTKGWIKRQIGKKMPVAQYRAYLELAKPKEGQLK